LLLLPLRLITLLTHADAAILTMHGWLTDDGSILYTRCMGVRALVIWLLFALYLMPAVSASPLRQSGTVSFPNVYRPLHLPLSPEAFQPT